MTSNIDPSVPVFGSPTTASVRQNFQIAHDEITALQNAIGVTVPIPVISGGTGAINVANAQTNLGILPITGGTMTGLLNLSGNPTNTLGAATKQYVDAYFPVAVAQGGTGANNPTQGLANLGGAPLASPIFTGVPQAPTAPTSDSSTIIATTNFVHSVIAALPAPVTSIVPGTGISAITTGGVATIGLAIPVTIANGGTGATNATAALSGLGGAPLLSPVFTGTPAAPTPPVGNNSTQIATTAFVAAAITSVAGVTTITGANGGGIDVNGATGNPATGAITLALVSPVSIANGGTGATTAPQAVFNIGAAPIASPAFTGTPTAPTAAPGNNSTQIATTAFVDNAIGTGVAGVASFNTRTGAVTLTAADVTGVGGALASNLANYLPLAGGTVTGPITLPGNAAANLQAVPLQQMNTAIAGYLPLSGGTITGSLVVSGNFNTNAISCTTINTNGNTITCGSISATTGTINCGALIASGAVESTNGNIVMGTTGIRYAALSGGNEMGWTWNGGLGIVNVYVDSTFVGGLTPSTSDANLKENIEPVTIDPLATLMQVELAQFDWKDRSARPHWSCGYVAQNLQGIIPEAVHEGPDGSLGVDQAPLIAYLIGAVQQLSAKFDAQGKTPTPTATRTRR